ncbi:MAG: hypothetical protein M5U09_22815 [Gammaproteobacteria bacterium]|nr:hypothetical protein [Gammaproteobacteria bacterium]
MRFDCPNPTAALPAQSLMARLDSPKIVFALLWISLKSRARVIEFLNVSTPLLASDPPIWAMKIPPAIFPISPKTFAILPLNVWASCSADLVSSSTSTRTSLGTGCPCAFARISASNKSISAVSCNVRRAGS